MLIHSKSKVDARIDWDVCPEADLLLVWYDKHTKRRLCRNKRQGKSEYQCTVYQHN